MAWRIRDPQLRVVFLNRFSYASIASLRKLGSLTVSHAEAGYARTLAQLHADYAEFTAYSKFYATSYTFIF